MAYSADRKPGELTALTTLATDDVFVVGDASDASEVAKGITKANLLTDLASTFAPVLGADDNYVTDAEKAALHAAVTVTDGTTVNLTLTGQDLTAEVIDSSITNAKLAGMADGTIKGRALSAGAGPATDLSATQVRTLINVEDGADVTDATNVTAAGALMDSECTSLASVKALNQGVATTDSPQFAGVNVGHASDTTITRVSAGLIAVEGSNLIRASDVDDTPVNGETAVPVSSNWAFDHAALASSDTVVGHVELAIASEVNTGTSTALAVSPDGLAGSYAGTKSVSIQVYDGGTDVAIGDGKAYITIPEALNGMNLVRAQATVVTAGTTNATTVMIHNKTDAADMLSGAISIASAGTVGTVGTVNGTYDDVATNDVLRVDVDSVSTTAPKGLQVILEFRLP